MAIEIPSARLLNAGKKCNSFYAPGEVRSRFPTLSLDSGLWSTVLGLNLADVLLISCDSYRSFKNLSLCVVDN